MRIEILAMSVCACLTFTARGALVDDSVDASMRDDESSLRFTPAPLTGPLVTDRPDFTESTEAVPRGHFQIEAGYTYTRDSGGARSHTVGELLARIGLANDFELRIESPSLERRESAGASTTGVTDVGVGFKYKLFDQHGARPHLGVIGQISAPTGSGALTSDQVDSALKLLWAYDASERVAVGGNINFESLTEAEDRFLQIDISGSVAFSLTDRLGSYVEYFGFNPVNHGPGSTHFINTGLTYLVTDNFQLDARIGFGLNARAEDVFVGFGFSWRN